MPSNYITRPKNLLDNRQPSTADDTHVQLPSHSACNTLTTTAYVSTLVSASTVVAIHCFFIESSCCQVHGVVVQPACYTSSSRPILMMPASATGQLGIDAARRFKVTAYRLATTSFLSCVARKAQDHHFSSLATVNFTAFSNSPFD